MPCPITPHQRMLRRFAPPASPPPGVLLGMCIGVSIYWLFALSMGPLLPSIARALGIGVPSLALPTSLAGLVAGICIMPAGGLADRLGRLLLTRIGLALGLAGVLAATIAWTLLPGGQRR